MILPVILTILKIIGIILLSILGLALLIILLVLFVPIRYKGGFARTGNPEDEPITAAATVSWLMHIVHISVHYPDETYVTVRIFGIKIMKIPNDKPKKTKAKVGALTETQTESDSNNQSDTVRDAVELNEDADVNSAQDTRDAMSEEEADFLDFSDTENDSFDGTSEEQASEAGESFFDRIEELKCTIANLYDKIKSVFSGVQNKTINIKKNIHYYHTILTSDLFDRTFEKTKKKLIKLLKEILPRRFQMGLEVGFDDPATTGEVLALAGMLYPLWGSNVRVTGNFDEVIIRGAGKFKGRIFIFSFVKIALYYLFNKDLKRLIRLLKKEEKSRGRKQ